MITILSRRSKAFARALRLATLAAFFHFAGIHNGCAAMLAVSPIQPLQSVLAAAQVAQKSPELFRSVFQPLRYGQKAVLSLTQKASHSAVQTARSFKADFSHTLTASHPEKGAQSWTSNHLSQTDFYRNHWKDPSEAWKRLDEDRAGALLLPRLRAVQLAPSSFVLSQLQIRAAQSFQIAILRKMLRSITARGEFPSFNAAIKKNSPQSPWHLNQGDFFMGTR